MQNEDITAILGSWWQDPELNGLGRLAARVVSEPLERLDLAGSWRFKLVDSPAHPPSGWTQNLDTDNKVEVPGNWTMQDQGDHPHYTNVVMPFVAEPPLVPVHNPTGLYQLDFELPQHWLQQRVILHLGGVESAAAIWCNQNFVGIMTDSRLPSEFDLSPALQEGLNKISVMVVRWSAHSWVEDQDHWHHGGIHRKVELLCLPPELALNEVIVDTDYDSQSKKASLKITARVDGVGGSITAALYEGEHQLWTTPSPIPVAVFERLDHLSEMALTYEHPGPLAVIEADFDPDLGPAITPWSHENPHLYTLSVTAYDDKSEPVQVSRQRIGFTRVQVSERELLLNGVAVPIVGVNRHDHHPDKGKTMSAQELWAEAEAIKAAGMNSVRSAHYPPDSAFLDACDELGLWVICEANLESHGRWQQISNETSYQSVFFDRVKRMVAFHRNHASVMGWSLGNESGHGPAHDAAAAWVHKSDPARFVHYEGAVRNRWLADPASVGSQISSDIVCPMYPSVEDIVKWAQAATVRDKDLSDDNAPLIMCEYSHAMGNSNGGLADYWQAIETHHGLQGGFIWDWKDQGLRLADGSLGYGGHFGDQPNDGDFCCNGLVSPDGNFRPAIEELRFLTRPVVSDWDSVDNTLTIHNRRSFTNIDDLKAKVSIEPNGADYSFTVEGLTPAESRQLSQKLDIADVVNANAVSDAECDAAKGAETAGTERFLTIRWYDRHDQLVAWDQHKIGGERPTVQAAAQNGSVLNTGPKTVPSEFAEVFVTSPQLCLWRAPTDNDGISVGPLAGSVGALARWSKLGLDQLTVKANNGQRRSKAQGEQHWSSPAGFRATHHYNTTRISDRLWLCEDVINLPEDDSGADLPRVGISFTLPASWSQLRWFGPGPTETYPDRANALVTVWESSVDEQFIDYVLPQHHGSHWDTRWFSLCEDSGKGVRIVFDQPGVSFNASRYSIKNLSAATTIAELEPDDVIHVNIDIAIRGVGTAACGPDTTVKTKAGQHRFKWLLSIIG